MFAKRLQKRLSCDHRHIVKNQLNCHSPCYLAMIRDPIESKERRRLRQIFKASDHTMLHYFNQFIYCGICHFTQSAKTENMTLLHNCLHICIVLLFILETALPTCTSSSLTAERPRVTAVDNVYSPVPNITLRTPMPPTSTPDLASAKTLLLPGDAEKTLLIRTDATAYTRISCLHQGPNPFPDLTPRHSSRLNSSFEYYRSLPADDLVLALRELAAVMRVARDNNKTTVPLVSMAGNCTCPTSSAAQKSDLSTVMALIDNFTGTFDFIMKFVQTVLEWRQLVLLRNLRGLF